MASQQQIVKRLQQQILRLEGYKPPVAGHHDRLGLGDLENAFPNGVFPKSTVHEFVCGSNEQAAATGGFVTGILAMLARQGGVCIWIGRPKRIYAPALKTFGINPHQVIFIHLTKDDEALWAMEEALKCPGLTAVIAELGELDFKQSRRLQLAVEHSRVTGFVLRNAGGKIGSTACAARWHIQCLPSITPGNMPGVGYARWQVNLLKVRNGQTGSWQFEWQGGNLLAIDIENTAIPYAERQVG